MRFVVLGKHGALRLAECTPARSNHRKWQLFGVAEHLPRTKVGLLRLTGVDGAAMMSHPDYHVPTSIERAFLWGVIATLWLIFGSLLVAIGWLAVRAYG
jgi:hypothetical protein